MSLLSGASAPYSVHSLGVEGSAVDTGRRLASSNVAERKRGFRLSSAVLIAAVPLMAFGCLMRTADDTGGLFWVAMNLSAVSIVTGVRGRLGRLDLTEPIHWINAMCVLMFVVHPFFVITDGLLNTPYHFLFDIGPRYTAALRVAFCGIVALNLGYGLTPPQRLQKKPIALSGKSLLRTAKFTTFLGLLGLCNNILAGGSLTSAFSKSASGGGTAYVYMLPLLLVPASVMWVCAGHTIRRRRYSRMGTVLAVVLVLLAAAAGVRTALLGIVAPPVLYMVIVNRRRVSRLLIPVAICAAIVAFAALRDVNATAVGFNRSISDSVSNPVSSAKETLDGSDTEMVDALSLEMEVVPSVLPYHPGQVLFATAGAPIPRSVWPGKPKTVDVVLNALFFNKGVNDASVAYSILGEGYYDLGIAGAIIISALTGLIFKRIARLGQADNRPPSWGLLIFCVATPLTITVLRGIVAYSLAYALFYVGPLLLGVLIERRSIKPTQIAA